MSSTSLFTQHSRLWQDNRFVYPVISRRSRGLSIGVNLNPDKRCNFDCVYCSVDRSVPGPAIRPDLEQIERELGQLLDLAASGELFASGPLAQTPADLRRINDVALSGDAEPTSAPEFPQVCRLAVRLLRERKLEAVKVVVITNATLLDRKEVAEALAFLARHRGEIWAKLDAGTQEHYRRVNRSRVPLERVLANLREAGRAQPLVIQSLFLRLHGEPPAEAEIAAWLERLRALREAQARLERVQVYTVARMPAESWASPLETERLEAIAERVRALGIDAEVFPAPAPA